MQVSGCRSDDLLETMCRGGVTDDPRRAIYDKHNAAGGKRLVPSGHIVSRIKHQGKNQVQNKEVEKEDESSNSGSIYMPSTTPEKVVVYQMTVICSLGGGINE